METLHLFPVVDKHLIDLLNSLESNDWNKPTVAKKWTVKDISAHLLDVTMRDVSIYRDHFYGPSTAVTSYTDLVNYLNTLNATWVSAYQRVSPRQIIEMLEIASKAQYEELLKLDQSKQAIFSVGWAGETKSTNEFHIAREYTEKFHHQLQIRDAVGKTDALLTKDLFTPFIYTLLRGLPNLYRSIEAVEGTGIQIKIPPFGEWTLSLQSGAWKFDTGNAGNPVSVISIDPETAWKLFTKAKTKEEASGSIRIEGDQKLGAIVLSMISVMA